MGYTTPSVKAMLSLAEELRGCCLHADAYARASTADRVLAAACDCSEGYSSASRLDGHAGPPGCGTDKETVWLFATKDGRYGVLEECEDYTGHG